MRFRKPARPAAPRPATTSSARPWPLPFAARRCVPGLLLLGLLASVHAGGIPANYEEDAVPAYSLPPVLVAESGDVITTVDEWNLHRPRLLEIFRREVYGRTPEHWHPLRATVTEADTPALEGLALRRQVTLEVPWVVDLTRPPLKLHILIYRPAAASAAVPAFIALNFLGNTSVDSDPAILSSTAEEDPGERGRQARRWPLRLVVSRGYAVATLFYEEVEADRPDGWKSGVRAALSPRGERTTFADDDWGAISAWAWAHSRILDYLATDPGAFDARRVAVVGHSRLGKAALWAGAQDERIALVVANNSGQGGAALGRRFFGETNAHLNASFPHWFCRRFRAYDSAEASMPVDQHQLLALVAPRALHVASATHDAWADPRGEFLAVLHAEPVFRLHGLPGLGTDRYPAPGTTLGTALAYHLRAGGHDILAYDWERFLDGADRALRLAPSPRVAF